ncbi:hypothetical protein [Psychroserpens ponticola]|uniref:Uncharacterized protein n=1 Tax=Psychroserpens ponticola TaxID=2932268 RepID=A0ABY7RZV3_9FLAO|nr:hypothetical protein [Psychroserpens ponticola]WCO02681.1 hypothetical protein MUN68_004095 [Psychroserpens ponticola]
MKYFKIIAILLFSSVISFYSCNDTTKAPKEDSTKPLEVENLKTEPTTATPTTKEPAQNTAGVWHYTCRIGCPGGAGKADKCGTCGNVLAHNTTYHDKANSATTAPFAAPVASKTVTQDKKPEPAQNSAGVWHYTCSKGCAGGSGAAGSCSTCKGALAHNSAYH